MATLENSVKLKRNNLFEGGVMVAGLEPRKERVKIRIRHSCTTNDLNSPDYFDDYYEEKYVWQKVQRAKGRQDDRG